MRFVGRLRTNNTVSIDSDAVPVAITLPVDFYFIGLTDRKGFVVSTFAEESNHACSSCAVVKLAAGASGTPSIDHLEVEIADTSLEILPVYAILRTNRFTEPGRIHYEPEAAAANSESSSIAILRAGSKTFRLEVFKAIITLAFGTVWTAMRVCGTIYVYDSRVAYISDKYLV